MKRTIITILIVLVVAIGIGFVLKHNKDEMAEKVAIAKTVNETVPVQVTTVKKEVISGGFTTTGNFTPAKQLVVVTEVSGKIVSLPVDEGDQVQKGQLMARIEYATLAADLNAAEANLKKLTTDKARYEKLVTSGGVTQSQLDDINLAYVNAETRVITARKKLADTYIRAPFSGYVNKRYVEDGAYLNAGSQVFEILQTSKLTMMVNVTETQVLAVNEAEHIVVRADVYPDTSYMAHVNFIGAKADANLNFPVELEITNIADKPLRAGMYGRATFTLPSKTPSLVIPRTALIGSIDHAQVFVVTGDHVTLQDIVPGRSFANTVEVIRGLEEGDPVVTNGQINLSDGTKITVLSNQAGQ